MEKWRINPAKSATEVIRGLPATAGSLGIPPKIFGGLFICEAASPKFLVLPERAPRAFEAFSGDFQGRPGKNPASSSGKGGLSCF